VFREADQKKPFLTTLYISFFKKEKLVYDVGRKPVVKQLPDMVTIKLIRLNKESSYVSD
jgi:hypothetical protein